MSNEEDPHKVYVFKLRKIGKRLNFETKGLETSTGSLDCIWRHKIPSEFMNLLKIPNASGVYEVDYIHRYGLPLIAFEVIYSEKTKQLRGSLLNMISAKPSLAIFVFLRKIRKQGYPDEDVDKTEEYIKRLCQEFAGLLRTEVWHEDEVNDLYKSVFPYSE